MLILTSMFSRLSRDAIRYATSSIISAALCLSTAAEALVLPLTLREMVARADLIIVAKVTEVADHRAHMRVVKRIKGKPGRAVTVNFATEFSSHEPSFRTGETYVVFLYNSSAGMGVVQGYAGTVLLKGSSALGIHMDGEPRSQSTEVFLEKLLHQITS